MIVAALAVMALVAQDPPPAPPVPTQEPYSPPPIRPFEPPSDFGRQPPQGDAASRPFRSPLSAPVTVTAYVGQYEAQPTSAEAQYAQGVAAAELSRDVLAGPLDGRWSVVDGSGRPLLRLVLDDPGPGLQVEGAWRAANDPVSGVASSGRRDRATADLILHGGETLSLTRVEDGWTGTLTDAQGRTRTVRLVR